MLEILLIVAIVALAWFWSVSLKAREIALTAVKRHCSALDLQLLDEYVALTGLWPKRNRHGKFEAWRAYAFEFSATGEDRYNGKIILLGHCVESIYLEPHRDPQQNRSADHYESKS